MDEVKKSLKDEIDDMMECLIDYEVSPNESKERATKFFALTYRVNNKIRDIENEIIKANVLATAAYAGAFKSIEEKNVTKVKALANADKSYLKQDIELKRLEAEKSYWKNVYDIMNNGHIFYRGMNKF